jgi:hypothetical protein
VGDPADFGITDGNLMDFVVQRRGNTFTISVNGAVVQEHTSDVEITSLGLRPHRATMKLYDWTVSTGSDDCPGAMRQVPYADIRMNTCYTFQNADGLNIRWHETDPTGDCHGDRPIYATAGSVGTTNDRYKFVPSLCTSGGQCGGTSTGSAISGNTMSIESCSTPQTYLRHCYYHIWAGQFGNGPDYDFTWVMQEGDVADSIQIRTTADQFGQRDIEVIPSDAPFSNIGQNNGAREYGLTMVEDGNYQNWFVMEADDVTEPAQMLGGDGALPTETTLLTTIDSLPLDYEIGFDITPGPQIQGDWAALVHFTATDTNCCDYGSRVPGIWFWPSTRKILVVDGHGANGNSHTGQWGCDDSMLTTEVGVTINLKMVMASDLVTIYINDEVACSTDRADRQVWPDVKVYAPALWNGVYPAADVTLGNLYYCPGTCGGPDETGVDPDGVASVTEDGYGTMQWQGDTWYLVRRSTGSRWHTANDEAQGDWEPYGGYNPDPVADDVLFSVEYASWPWDKMLMASGDMTEWVILPRDLVDGFGEEGTPSCNNCVMPLIATSQGNNDALQYMRPGAQEDPWLSAGHHPDQIVYGENGDANSWHVGAGDALTMGGANVWVNGITAAPPTSPPVDPCTGLDVPGGDTICESITSGSWHNTVDMSQYDDTAVCFIGAATGGDNCANYCAALGRSCMQAQDNVGACGIGGDHTRQTTEENGCLQNWGGQICGCSGPDPREITCADVSQPDVDPTECYDDVAADVPLWMDRS